MIEVNSARRQQIDYIGITEEDLAFLKTQELHFARITDKLVDELYDRILNQPPLAAIIHAHSSVERLKGTQKWYFQSMVEGHIDQTYIDKRLYVGKVHSRIGLTTDWYLGTYMLYLDIATKHLKVEAPDQWLQIILALSKMFNFDSQLVLEAYETDEKALVQQMADERQHMITKISTAVQELASMMVELSSSTQTVAETATQTAELQEKSHSHVETLHAQIKDIRVMGSVIKEISEQTHLLGLNAAIEAARAGDEGLGFQVIANEIRRLADHSKLSLVTIQERLQVIGAILTEVQTSSEETVKLARDQAASSEELYSFANMIESITAELDSFRKS